MTRNGFWGRFADAEASLRDGRNLKPEIKKYAGIYANHLADSQKFYLPDAADVLDGRIIDSSIKKLLRLPADRIAILWDCNWIDDGGECRATSPIITLASELSAAPGAMCAPMCVKFFVTSVIYDKNSRTWFPAPVAAEMSFPEEDGYQITPLTCPGINMGRFSPGTVDSANLPDAAAVMNLCVLLGTKAATPVRIPAPVALNKARVKASKPCLPDYHVLKVGGELWDQPARGGGGPNGGYRSHFRRGHIRHLGENKFTWVRHTIVTGSREGFAKKDYYVTPVSPSKREGYP